MTDNVVITGMGICSPIGCSEERFWHSLCHGESGASPVDRMDTSELPRKIACQIRERIEVNNGLGRASRLAASASRQAIAGARVVCDEVDLGRFAVIVGTTMGETDFIEARIGADEDEWLSRVHVREILTGRPGSIADNVRLDLGIAGPATDLYGACAAGNMAMAVARRRLLDGRCDVVLAGGADGFSRLAFLGFMRLRAMAQEVCRPFDQQRDGLLVGEGSAMFVMERESDARARGASIRACLAGCGLTCENYHPTRPEPEGDGLTRATRAALADAGLHPRDIDYVCAHGTGTPHNDAVEVKSLHTCFPDGVRFSSIKALTGHTMGAASAIEAACCVLTLEHQKLIPTWHLTNVLQPCESQALKDRVYPHPTRCVLNNSAGFGGYNSSVVLSKA